MKSAQNNGRAQRSHAGRHPLVNEEKMESRKLVKPTFTTDCPEAVVRERADELTLRRKKKGCAPSLTPRMWETADWATARG